MYLLKITLQKSALGLKNLAPLKNSKNADLDSFIFWGPIGSYFVESLIVRSTKIEIYKKVSDYSV